MQHRGYLAALDLLCSKGIMLKQRGYGAVEGIQFITGGTLQNTGLWCGTGVQFSVGNTLQHAGYCAAHGILYSTGDTVQHLNSSARPILENIGQAARATQKINSSKIAQPGRKILDVSFLEIYNFYTMTRVGICNKI